MSSLRSLAWLILVIIEMLVIVLNASGSLRVRGKRELYNRFVPHRRRRPRAFRGCRTPQDGLASESGVALRLGFC